MARSCLAVLSGLLLVAACQSAPAAWAGCRSAVVVDGTMLFGQDAPDWKLPATEGSRNAVVPACNDAGQNDPDGTTTVLPFKGVPADIAVRSRSGNRFYLADGSLTAASAHPLHKPSGRAARRRCGREQELAGTATYAGFDTLALRSGGRERFVRIDARTRLTNRPAYQPVREGQQLSVTAMRCRNRLYANRITFVGPTLRPALYRGQRGEAGVGSVPWGLLAIASVCLGLAGFVLRRLFR